MSDRDCKSCLFNSYSHGGCCSWDCEYINRREAAEAWREKRSRQAIDESRDNNESEKTA